MFSDLKIIFFSIIIMIAITLSSCNKENDVIPDVYVDFTLDINDPQFVDLASVGNHAIVTSQTNNWGSEAAGYNYNGIIVYTSGINVFNAYDRTCPHEYSVDGSSVKIDIDFTIGICPQCSTIYALSAGGVAYSGPGKYPLKNYKTSFDGRFVHVWNY